ncbi:hypothetical protein D3C73_1345790 [compost metagenome]
MNQNSTLHAAPSVKAPIGQLRVVTFRGNLAPMPVGAGVNPTGVIENPDIPNVFNSGTTVPSRDA